MIITAQTHDDVRHASLLLAYQQVRQASETLIAQLSAEDCALQAADFVSPPKWHLAHTTWFFETFILLPATPSYEAYDSRFQVLFNSYYNGVGEQFSRPQRHLLSRPSLEQVLAYRQHVDRAICALPTHELHGQADLINLGLHHEQQHQELLLMDTKYNFFQNPLYPAVLSSDEFPYGQRSAEMAFVSFAGGLQTIGANGHDEFCFDNETPPHRCYLPDFQLAERLVSNGEYLQFIQDGGYDEPSLWLSDGWSALQQDRAQAKPSLKTPLYWVQQEGRWYEFGLHGLTPMDPNRPVCHLSFYEASAYAQWAACRLPSEAEWEVAARQALASMTQMFDVCWQWTQSAYAPYPGFKVAAGAVGEYNGKFMCNQMVLRGGCALTPKGHVRASYRNFFYPKDRWPMSGLRLARDA